MKVRCIGGPLHNRSVDHIGYCLRYAEPLKIRSLWCTDEDNLRPSVLGYKDHTYYERRIWELGTIRYEYVHQDYGRHAKETRELILRGV